MNGITLSTQVLPHGISLACRANEAQTHDAQKPRVMLLHGFPEAAFVWDEVMRLLAPTASCLAPNEVTAYRAKHLVADVAASIQAWCGAQPLDLLVAHDWGGAVAWNLAAQQPQLMRRLLIINSPHPATFLRELRHNPAQQAASAYMNFLCRPDAAALLAENSFARLWPFFGQQPQWLTAPVRAQFVAAWTAQATGLAGPCKYYAASPLRPPAGATGAVGADTALHSVDLPDAAVTVQLPTTVLWGEQDVALLPGLLDGLAKWVPNLDLVRVPLASHWLVHENPALVAAHIQRLLRTPA
jgi:epoxide hydrolase 4